MSTQVWPFLISRNRYLDYRTVVAPDFICNVKNSNLLARVAEGELTEKGKGFIRHIKGSKVGNFTIAFRVIKALEQDIDITKGSNSLKDQFGREIYIFEGIVTKEIIKDLAINEDHFQKIHQRLISRYAEFWSLVEPAPAVPSHEFSLDTEDVTNPIVLEKLELLDLNPKIETTAKPTRISDREKNYSNKIPLKFLIILILSAVVVSLFGKVLFGSSISLGCATTLEEKVKFQPGNNISEQLHKRKKKYSDHTSIYISGYLEIESPKNIKNKEFTTKSNKQPTIKLEDDELHLDFHPIDLAIADMKNQKLNGNNEITLRLIDRSGCT